MSKRTIMSSVLVFALAAMLLCVIAPASQSPTTGTGFVQGLCNGYNGYGGIIPQSTILSGHAAGQQAVLGFSIVIMLTVILAAAILYMISYVFKLSFLREVIKSEFVEILITAAVVIIFIGGFYIASASVGASNSFAVAGSSFGRGLYVSDCVYLGSQSVNLIVPILIISMEKFAVTLISSLKVVIAPQGFGLSFSPLQGLALINNMFDLLTGAAYVLMGLIFSTMGLLGLIYGLFPLFLYAGILLRSLPWTRAAGGAFLGIFVGYYIVFPLLLHVMVASYAPAIQFTGYFSFTSIQNFLGKAAGSSGVLQSLVAVDSFFVSAASYLVSGGIYGVVNAFILGVIEPMLVVSMSIILSFLISFEIADLVGDALGAPSLSSKGILGKVI